VPEATHLFLEDLDLLEWETRLACGWLLGDGR
jgi:hypothetical protein